MPTECTGKARGSPLQRSRVTNGRSLFAEGGDMRSPWARRLRDVLSLHVSDLGGPDNISEAEKSFLRRAGTLTVELERMEAEFSTSKPDIAALDAYQRAANSLRRLLESVGLKRRAKDTTLTLQQYITQTYGPKETEPATEAANNGN